MTISTPYALAVTPYIDSDIDPECAVCFEEYRSEDSVHLLACEHLFHPACIEEQKICPLCRKEIKPLVTELEKGYAFYNLLYQLVTNHKNKHEWTPMDIDAVILELRNALSTHHDWNNYVNIPTFNDLCALIKKKPPSGEKARITEIFFKDLTQHQEFLKMTGYLQHQFLSLPQAEAEDTDSFWNMIIRVVSLASCLPLPYQDE